MIKKHIHHPVTNRLALTIGIAAFVIVVYWASFGSMWDLWQTTDHRHGVLVFPIATFLIWRLRHDLSGIPIQIDVRGLLFIVPLAALWMVARFAGVQVVEHFVVLAMIPATVFVLTGASLTHKLLFPLLFLLLATPLGDALVPTLMVVTADISTMLLKLSGIPVLRSGQYLSLPGGDFVVADVCSGLRYLVTGFMVSLLFAYLTYSNLAKRIALAAVTAVTLVVANGVRAYVVMAVASATNMQYLGGRDHIYFGWLLFGIVMMLIMWIAVRYADEAEVIDAASESTIVARASHTALPMIAALGLIMLAITIKPLQADLGDFGTMLAAAAAILVFVFMLVRSPWGTGKSSPTVEMKGPGNGIGNVLTAAVTIAVLIMMPRFVEGVEEASLREVAEIDLETVVPCNTSGEWSNHWRPSFQTADIEQALAFDCSGFVVNIFVAGYASALQGKELISSAHHPVPRPWDRYSVTALREVNAAEGQLEEVVEFLVDDGTYAAAIWYWYDIDEHIATNPFHAKFLQVLALAKERPSGGRIIVIETQLNGDPSSARQRLGLVANSLMTNGKSL